jgi:hypothetical protein
VTRAVGAKGVGAKRALEFALTGDPIAGGSRPSHHLASHLRIAGTIRGC